MDQSFGTWIKRWHKALAFSQHELAQRVGCSVSLIFKIEPDERRPSRQIAELIAQYLEILPEQREQFLRVARQQKVIDWLDSLAAPITLPISQPHHANLPLALLPLSGTSMSCR